MTKDRFAPATHRRRLGFVADHLERKIGLDAGAHVERAGVNKRPAAMIALNAPKIDGDQALEFEIGLLAAKRPEQDVLSRDCRIALEFETPMAVFVLTSEQSFRGARDVAFQRIRRRRVLSMVEGDVHREKLITRRLGAFAPEAITIEAALEPERTAPSIVAGRPVWTQSPARTTLSHRVRESGRLASCAGVAAKVARFSLTICQGGRSTGRPVNSAASRQISAASSSRGRSMSRSALLIVTESRSGKAKSHSISALTTPRIAGCPSGGAIWKWTLRMARNSSGAVKPGRRAFAIHGGTLRITKSSAPSSCCARSKSSATARFSSKRN